MIQGALDRNKHNQSAAARSLGIHRNTLQRKMVEFAMAARVRGRAASPSSAREKPRRRNPAAA